MTQQQQFALELDSLSAKHGWMDCWLVVDGQRHHLEATSVFPPFGDVLTFARALAQEKLPHDFYWEEEGHGAKFQALPVPSGDQNFRLIIDHDGAIVVDGEFKRKEIMLGLLEALRGVALNCPGAESEWDFPYFLIENFERDLARGFPPDSKHTAHFVFGHYGGYGGQIYPAFTIWVNERQTLYMAMDDIPRFWWMWFELLEKIGNGDLPTEAVFHKEVEDIYDDHADLFLMMGLDKAFRFQAQTLAEHRNFQLKIVSTVSSPEVEQVLLDAPLERRQLVEAFVIAFSEFLQTSYPAFLQSDENKFDLRTLPLDRLIV
jgi:hypothetical protein